MALIGVIGYRNHAARIIQCLKSLSISIDFVYHPHKKEFHPKATNNFKDILKCDAVFVCSPTDSHFEYINRLYKEGKYIFCEKPPVNKLSENEQLKQMAGKIFFNFNFRYSKLSEMIDRIQEHYDPGALVTAYISVTHGLAFKEGYASTWRADVKRHPLGVFETLSVHYIDLLQVKFGIEETLLCDLELMSGNGTAYDNAVSTFRLKNNAVATVHASYCAPAQKKYLFIYENGLLEMDDAKIVFRSPRESFNEQGFFIPPASRITEEVDLEADYVKSITKSVMYFLSVAEKGKHFSGQDFSSALQTNKIILEQLEKF